VPRGHGTYMSVGIILTSPVIPASPVVYMSTVLIASAPLPTSASVGVVCITPPNRGGIQVQVRFCGRAVGSYMTHLTAFVAGGVGTAVIS
jgi:hypothetical protein